ncbi:MAG: 6,7-dimethyl-8-ribityllumazine synthase [Ignavibacteria bacterium GWA2_35_9]|nr:MAG: 6,7-dimethyl-8-ribityllumazine synthase [Ignavibacteria bacterium GWA2_35_9]OGU45639.1 MAG: 6,7-dimethyl-8-ribityllumazine synthase [Ignavibacteria bacterium GWB2_36_8]OGU51930.1 MAG: 6,7-dimethyl-8-ribityllumazine synthase [Ignavibacteria bacterium GWC2_36_12]OGV27228.1 MAG: 6,7-dimethyl-8-ribityllumazine synthase [Ignavibacteria bacterium RIFOXYA2_FULL_37_17]
MNIIEGNKKDKNFNFAIIQSRFNEEICDGLLSGALNCLKESGYNENNIPVIKVPGAFEIPLVAEKLASQNKYDAIICLGAVIKGETAHFEYVSKAVTDGILQVGLKYGVPVIFGVLTTYDESQAKERSVERENNKGWEAANTAIEMASLMKKIGS